MTQGVVSIVDSTGLVIFKVVVGCNGYQVKEFISELERLGDKIYELDATSIDRIADECDLGCEDCRVIISHGKEANKEELTFRGMEDIMPDSLSRYFNTFQDATFNPRWEHGTADYLEVVQLDKEWNNE